jgi:phage terminase large subunit-like protein
MKRWDQFCEDVLSGKQHSNKYIKLAVKRHLSDLENPGKYYFNEKEAQRVINLIELLKHTKGELAGQRIHLEPWQCFAIAVIFGWLRQSDNGRRYTKCYFEVARKNGKSTFAAAIASVMLLADGEYSAEVYSAATKKDQAKVVFLMAKSMLKQFKSDFPRDLKGIDIRTNNVNIPDTESKMEAVASDSNTLDGLSPSCVIVDEYHAHKTSDLLEVMETGMGGRKNPLLFIITTAGFNKESPCYHLRKTVTQYLEGVKDSDTTFGLIFSLDEEDDWEDENNWVKANPNIGKSPYWRYMRSQYEMAKNEGYAKLVQFLTKNLNTWTTTSATWLNDQKFWENGTDWNISDFKGRDCHLALDLASTADISTLSVLFVPTESDPRYFLKQYHFCSHDNAVIRTKNDGVNYLKWEHEGHMILTPGNVTDYAYIKKKVFDLCAEFNVLSLQYDRWNSSQLIIELNDAGVKTSPFSQGVINMNAPTKEFERLVMLNMLDHGKDPVLRWMVSNVELFFDSSGNYKPDKKKSSEKIDGVISAIMAIGGAMTEKGGGLSESFIASGGFKS